jgi:PadR family transcriptional regulator AphA
VYQITDKGRRALEAWLNKPVDYRPYRMELLLKLFFAKDIPPSNVREKLLRDRQINEKRLEVYTGIEKMLTSSEPYRSQAALPLWLATLDFGKRLATMSMEWCDHTVRSLGLPAAASGHSTRTSKKGRK